MKRLLIAALFSAGAQAEPCAKLDFAELDSLPKEDLLQMRCSYRDTMLAPNLLTSSYGLGVGQRCAAEMERMERLLGRKYPLKAKDEDARMRELNAMCPKK